MMMELLQISCRLRAFLPLLLLAGLLQAPLSRAEDYDPVAVEDLLSQPQRFWARGVVFNDFLEKTPESRTRKVGDEKLYRFELRALGECYATPEAKDILDQLEPGQNAVFAGSVIQAKRKFYYRVAQVKAVTETPTNLLQTLSAVVRDSQDVQARLLAQFQEIADLVYAQLYAYAMAENIRFEDLLDNPEEKQSVLRSSIRSAIQDLQAKQGVPPNEFAVNLVAAMIALKENRIAIPEPDYAPEPIPEMEDDFITRLPLTPIEPSIEEDSTVTMPYNIPAGASEEVAPEPTVQMEDATSEVRMENEPPSPTAEEVDDSMAAALGALEATLETSENTVDGEEPMTETMEKTAIDEDVQTESPILDDVIEAQVVEEPGIEEIAIVDEAFKQAVLADWAASIAESVPEPFVDELETQAPDAPPIMEAEDAVMDNEVTEPVVGIQGETGGEAEALKPDVESQPDESARLDAGPVSEAEPAPSTPVETEAEQDSVEEPVVHPPVFVPQFKLPAIVITPEDDGDNEPDAP